MRIYIAIFSIFAVVAHSLIFQETARAQSYGVDLRNTLMPASGGMGGTSVAAPQDCVSAINGNPAAMTQFKGTHMTLGGGWAEPTFDLTQGVDAPGIGVGQFSDKSTVPGSVVPAIGVIQELEGFPVPIFAGIGFVGAAGAGTNFVNAPESNGTAAYLLLLEAIPSLAIELTEKLSIGGSMFIGDGFSSGPFVGTSKMTNAYSLRGGCGVNYAYRNRSWVGAYYLSTQEFRFKDQVIPFRPPPVAGVPQTVNIGLPQQIGLGWASERFMDNRLLLAADALYFDWESAALFGDIYNNAWALQLGSQYTTKRNVQLRCGYAITENPMNTGRITSIDGINPGGPPSINYTKAQFSIPNIHRISAGVGAEVYPHVHLDVFAGGMFPATQQLGQTSVRLVSYWLGFGFTWHFDPCSSKRCLGSGCSKLPSTCGVL